jgi:hypothetical protein
VMVIRRGAASGRGSYRWLVILVVVVAFGVWFGWASYQASRTEWVSEKVTAAMNGAIESLAPTFPRIAVHDSSTGERYYAPEVGDSAQAFAVFGRVLIGLNQDADVPPLKVTNVVMQSVYGSPDTIIVGYADVQFPLVAGLYRLIHVHTSIRVPHYQSPG